MKKYVLDFLRRGLMSSGLGPVVLAVLYLVMHEYADLRFLTVPQVCVGIFSLAALSFLAGGMNFIYQVERIPLMAAILIHGIVLYISYLITYIVNGWLDGSPFPIVVFSIIFILGYGIIWAVIYSIAKIRTARLNRILGNKQKIQDSSEKA